MSTNKDDSPNPNLAPVNLEKTKESKRRFGLYWDCCDQMREFQDEDIIYTDEDCISSIRCGIVFDKRDWCPISYCPFCGKALFSKLMFEISDARVQNMANNILKITRK